MRPAESRATASSTSDSVLSADKASGDDRRQQPGLGDQQQGAAGTEEHGRHQIHPGRVAPTEQPRIDRPHIAIMVTGIVTQIPLMG